MPPKKEEARAPFAASSVSAADFIEAFRDLSVAEAIAVAIGPFIARVIEAALEAKLAGIRTAVAGLARECAGLKTTLDAVNIENYAALKLQVDDQGKRLEDMEIYLHAHDLIICGLPESSYAERSSANHDADTLTADSHSSVEAMVLALCNGKLGVLVSSRDISVAHRLKAGKSDKHRPIIMRFNSRKIRHDVLRAKKKIDEQYR